jgi:CRP/FNR family transcriptional regulator, anaerobic regulatory protein
MRQVTRTATQTSCLACPLRRLGTFRAPSSADLEKLETIKLSEWTLPAGTTLYPEGSNEYVFTVLSGWVQRYQTLSDGRRQIIGIDLPGDTLGLGALAAAPHHHAADTLTPARVCVLNAQSLRTSSVWLPEAIALAVAAQERAQRYLTAIGRRTADERLAYLMLDLHDRCAALGLTSGQTLRSPLTQRHIADAVGLSLVHTNKTLRRLSRARGRPKRSSFMTCLS